jgi:hypothetical protein
MLCLIFNLRLLLMLQYVISVYVELLHSYLYLPQSVIHYNIGLERDGNLTLAGKIRELEARHAAQVSRLFDFTSAILTFIHRLPVSGSGKPKYCGREEQP